MRTAITLLAIILALQGIAFLFALPMWIPEMTLAPWIIGSLAYLLAGYFTIRLLRLVDSKMRRKMDDVARRVSITVLSLMVAGWLAFAGTATAFLADGGLFAPIYITQHEFSDPDTTIYVYDGSFLDPQTDLYVRSGIWPWLDRVATVYGRLWDDEPVQEGDWLVWPGFRIHLISHQITE